MASLRAHDLHFGYAPSRPVLRGVSAEFPAGSITVVIGPNGAGKSTLVRALLGFIRPNRGHVSIGEVNVLKMRAAERASRMAYVPQKGEVAFAFTVRAVVALGRFGSVGTRNADSTCMAVDSALESMKLLDRAGEPFGVLSAGQQQRATLARALAQLGTDPSGKFLLADEPVAAMDPNHAAEAMSVLRDTAYRGASVVTVLHDLTLAAAWADRVVALNAEGAVAASGDCRQVLNEDTLRSIYGVGFRIVKEQSNVIAVAARPDRP